VSQAFCQLHRRTPLRSDKDARAVNHALQMHKRLGNPIAIWKDGQVVIVPPEEIVVPEELTTARINLGVNSDD